MALADEVMSRYEGRKAGKAEKMKDEPESKAEAKDEGDEDSTAMEAAKAAFAAYRRGDRKAFVEAIRAICE